MEVGTGLHLQDLKDAVRQAVADDKAPGFNRVTAALIAELPEPVQGLLVHAYRAILRGADVPESWRETIIWLMPKGTATGNLDEYRLIALGQQDMRMLMTPLMRRFTAVLARKGLAADWQFGAMPGSTAAAPVFLAQRRLRLGLEENHVLAFDVSKAFDTAPHGALALLLRHMGVPEELIRLFHTLSCGSLVCIVTAHGTMLSIRLHRGLRQGSAESAVLYLLLLEPLLRSLACKAQGDARHAVPPLVQAYCDDLLLIAHSLPQFLEYAAAIARYLTDMGMSLNVGKCAYGNTARIHSIMVCLSPGSTAAPWVCLRAKGTVPYLGLRLDPRGVATMKEKHVLRCEALLGSCKKTFGLASVPHEVMAAVVGGIVRYAAPYLSDTADGVIKLNTAIKAAALQFEKLPKDLSNVAVRSGHGLRLADVQAICRDSVVATMAQLTHHRLTTVRDELRAMLRDMHVQYRVCGQFMVPSASFATHAGNTWVDRVLRAMGMLRVGLHMPSSVYSCVHAHLPQVQWAGRKWVSQSYSFKGRDICVLSGPRTDATVQSLTDPANDLLHARLPCPVPGHWAVQLQECHEEHLHLPHAGVGPHQLDHVWFTGLRDVFHPQLPSPLTHRLIHPVRRKKASKRKKQCTAGDVYVVGEYRGEGWDPANPGLSMPFVPLAALLFLFGDVFEGYKQQDNLASVPILTPHAGGGISPPPLWVVHGRPAFSRTCAAVHGCSEWAIVLLLPAGPIPYPDEYSVPEVVRMSNVPHDPHVAFTLLRDGGAVEQGSVVVYQPSCSATVWGAEYTTALDAIKSVCGCDLAWRPHAVYRPRVVLSSELTASSAEGAGAGTKARRKRAPRQTPRPTPRKGIPRRGDQHRPTPTERPTTPGGAPPNKHRRSKHRTPYGSDQRTPTSHRKPHGKWRAHLHGKNGPHPQKKPQETPPYGAPPRPHRQATTPAATRAISQAPEEEAGTATVTRTGDRNPQRTRDQGTGPQGRQPHGPSRGRPTRPTSPSGSPKPPQHGPSETPTPNRTPQPPASHTPARTPHHVTGQADLH